MEDNTKGTVPAFQINKDTKRVETLNDFELYENGQHVFSPNNKPSPSDIGALPTAGKAVDSAKLNGAVDSSTATANTIAKRDTSSDITARLLRTTYSDQDTISGAIAYRVNNISDNYTRYCSSKPAIRTFMEVYSKAESDGRFLGKTATAVKASNADKLGGIEATFNVENKTSNTVIKPIGGEYRSKAASVTGALRINLPTNTLTYNSMLTMNITVFDYADHESFTCTLSGYTYAIGESWVGCSAYMTGGTIPRNVRFCRNASRPYILIGEVTSTWAYPQVTITDVEIGYADDSAQYWHDGWLVDTQTTIPSGDEKKIIAMGKQYTTANKPTAADVGALTKAQGDSYYLGKTAKATDSDKLDGLNSTDFSRSNHVHSKTIINPVNLTTSDLDTITAPGFYFQDANANATAARHYPATMAGALTVKLTAGVVQEYHAYNSSLIWTRAKYASTAWTTWAKQYNTANKPTAADVKAVAKSGDSMTGILALSGNLDWRSITMTKSGDKNDHFMIGRGDTGWLNELTIHVPSKDYTVNGETAKITFASSGSTRLATIEGETGAMWVKGAVTQTAAQSTLANALTRKDYVNAEDAKKLNLTGGTLSNTLKIKTDGTELNIEGLWSNRLGGRRNLVRLGGSTDNPIVVVGDITAGQYIYTNDIPKIKVGAGALGNIYYEGNKPTAADVGALTKAQGDGYYLGKTAKAADSDKLDGKDSTSFVTYGAGSYSQILGKNGSASDWLRTTSSGILPNSNNSGSLGTSSWKFKEIHGITLFENGITLANTYLGKTDQAVESVKASYIESVDDRDIKPNTTGITSSVRGVKPFFASRSAFPAGISSTYVDLLVMDTYADSTGGGINALALGKNDNSLYHVQAGFNAETWNTPAKIYTSANKPTAAEVGALTKAQGDSYYLGKSATAVMANKVNVINSTSAADYPVVWNNNSNQLHDTTGKLMFNPSTGKLMSTLVYEGANRVYSAANKPTAADVGALPINKLNGTPVAAYYTTSNSSTLGTKVRLPFKTNAAKMVSFTIRVYQGYKSHDIQVSGYLYAPDNNWYTPNVIMIAGSHAINVAMGRDDEGYAYVWVAGGTYRGVGVFDVVAGYGTADWNTGWEITETDEKPNTVLNETIYPPYSPSNKPTAADVGALTKAQGDGYYLGKTATAEKVKFFGTTFSGKYPLTVSVNGQMYSHPGITFEGNSGTLTVATTIVEGGTSLTNKYLGKTAKATSAVTADKIGAVLAANVFSTSHKPTVQEVTGTQDFGTF